MDVNASTGLTGHAALAPRRRSLLQAVADRPLWWIVTMAAGMLGYLMYWLNGHARLDLATFTSMLMAIFLGVLPTLICTVQATTKGRQLRKLRSLAERRVATSSFYETARVSIDAIEPASIDNDYRIPLIALFFMNCAGFGLLFTALFVPEYFNQRYVLLMGLSMPDGTSPAAWQLQTFTIVGMAFVGSYIYTLGRLLDRVNNADLYPISVQYYVARPVIACFAAVVLRHTVGVLGPSVPATYAGLLLLAFAMGLAPDLFLVAMARRAFQWMKIWGTRADPEPKLRPAALPLMMIDDLTREKVDRLNELGIDSAHALAYQNPFLIWLRLPFELGLLVDWIAQAQLFVLVGADRLAALHRLCVMNIFDLALRLAPDAGNEALCRALGIDAAAAPTLLVQIRTDQSFSRLLEVRNAMLRDVDATPGA